MAFEIIKTETIVARMVIWFGGIQKKVTDFIPGGKTRTKFEALAVEIEYQYSQFYGALKKAIAVAIYTAFGFTLRPPIAASGYVTFTAAAAPAQDIPIPVGTQVSSESQTYITTALATLPSGETTVNVPVACITAGTIGNSDIGTLIVLKTAVAGITAVTNAAALVNGLDWETEDQRKNRFQKFINSLSRATDAANEYGATTAQLLDDNGNVTELVVDAKVVGPPVTAASHFNLYIWNGVGQASSELVAKTQQIIDGYMDSGGKPVPGYKAAGDICSVISVEPIVGNVALDVVAKPDADEVALELLIVRTVTTYIQNLLVGNSFALNEMIRRVKNLAGVSDFTVVDWPDDNILISQVLVPGAVTVDFP